MLVRRAWKTLGNKVDTSRAVARRSGVALVRATLSRLGLAAVRAVARVSSFDLGICVVNKILRFYPVSPTW